MNKNIEIINKKLWAVRFSWLDFIPEISIKPDPTAPIEEEPGRITNDGLMILNKDHQGYLRLRTANIESVKAMTENVKVIVVLLALNTLYLNGST